MPLGYIATNGRGNTVKRINSVNFGAIAGLAAVAAHTAAAAGVSAYLPLNLEPETERQIERVLILADEPVLKRPIASPWSNWHCRRPANATRRFARK